MDTIFISKSYYKPAERDVLEDYSRAIDLITINSDGITLKKQVQKLKEDNKSNEYVIKGKLQEKDQEIRELLLKDKVKEEAISNLSDQLVLITERLNQLEKIE